MLADLLNPEKALIFRITHCQNIPWILEHGLHCRTSETLDPDFIEIGNPDVIARRRDRAVPIAPGGVLAHYVPFYFTPRSPMLFNITSGYQGMKRTRANDIAIIVASLRELQSQGVAFLLTDRNAALATATYANDLSGLDRLDWPRLKASDFSRSPDDPGKIERYQAEALIHRHLPTNQLMGIAVYDEVAEASLRPALTSRGSSLKLAVRRHWYCS